jgi:hypothetical protein
MLGTRLLLLLDTYFLRVAEMLACVCSAFVLLPIHCIAWILFGFNFVGELVVTVRP